MSRAGRVALIALGALLLLPGACSAMALPFFVMSLPFLFSADSNEFALGLAGASSWFLGLALGYGGFRVLRKLRTG